MGERDPAMIGFGVRCLVGYNKRTGGYAVISYVDGEVAGHNDFELYEAAVAHGERQRQHIHDTMMNGAPIGSRVFEVDTTKIDAAELIASQDVQAVDEAFILERYAYMAEHRPSGMCFRFFASPNKLAAFSMTAKAAEHTQYGVMLLSTIGNSSDGKLAAQLRYRPKLALSEEAAANEAKVWLASELTALDSARAAEE